MPGGPDVSRVRLPERHGLSPESRLLEWADIDARLAAASNEKYHIGQQVEDYEG
jgi:hypothetical protein